MVFDIIPSSVYCVRKLLEVEAGEVSSDEGSAISALIHGELDPVSRTVLVC
jgi:hypothetical protein